MKDHQRPESARAEARARGIHPNTVVRARHEANPVAADGTVEVRMVAGLDGKVRPDRRYDTTERDAQIRKLRAKGRSIRQIADEVGCSVGTVHRVTKQGEGR